MSECSNLGKSFLHLKVKNHAKNQKKGYFSEKFEVKIADLVQLSREKWHFHTLSEKPLLGSIWCCEHDLPWIFYFKDLLSHLKDDFCFWIEQTIFEKGPKSRFREPHTAAIRASPEAIRDTFKRSRANLHDSCLFAFRGAFKAEIWLTRNGQNHGLRGYPLKISDGQKRLEDLPSGIDPFRSFNGIANNI